MKTLLSVAASLVTGFVLMSAATSAQAGPVRVGVGVDIGVPYQGGAYLPQQAVYVQPPPVYVQGGPIYADDYWHGGWHDRRWVQPQWHGYYCGYGRGDYYDHYGRRDGYRGGDYRGEHGGGGGDNGGGHGGGNGGGHGGGNAGEHGGGHR